MKNEKVNASAIRHNISQRSQAIYKNAIKQPVSQVRPLISKIGHNMDIVRSKSIARFAPNSSAKIAVKRILKPISAKKQTDIGPSKHPIAAKADKKLQPTTIVSKAPEQQPTAAQQAAASRQAIKEQAISTALSQMKTNDQPLKRQHKFRNIALISLAVIAVLGYFVFTNLPVISVNIASAQAGIKATFPQYKPDGYRLNGAITYSDGAVTINFVANTGDKKFTLTETRSSWDSTAVKNKISKDSKEAFATTEENGLTIYSYNNNAAWVNGGILYTISGTAILSNSQISHIANSL